MILQTGKRACVSTLLLMVAALFLIGCAGSNTNNSPVGGAPAVEDPGAVSNDLEHDPCGEAHMDEAEEGNSGGNPP